MFKEKAKGFIAGALVATTLIAGVSALASVATINVSMGGIKIYWDGIERTLTNVKGEKVEPLRYGGTTYVPIRGMATLMGKEVDYDPATGAVYIGGRSVLESTPISDMTDKINKENDIYIATGENAKFNLKNKEVVCSNLMRTNSSKYQSGYVYYMLDGEYDRLTGKAVFPYEEIGANEQGYIAFYDVANDGTETEIVRYNLKQTEEPIDIDVNLNGTVNLKIYIDGYRRSPVLYDAYFIGAK